MAILVHEYINELLKPFLKIRESKIALNQTLTLKLGVTLVLTVTQVYVFVNLRRVTSPATLRPLQYNSLFLITTVLCSRMRAGGQYHYFISNSLTLVHVKTTLPGCVQSNRHRTGSPYVAIQHYFRHTVKRAR